MKRTKHNTTKDPDLILVGDVHLREDQPTCRTDDFPAAQWRKIDFIRSLQNKYGCEVIQVGDLFHHWKPSPYLLTTAIRHFPDKFYCIYGQHDLPQHNLDLAYKCGINTLIETRTAHLFDTCHWGQTPDKPSWKYEKFFPHENRKITKNILVWHTMNYQGKKPWPDCTDPSAARLLKKYPQFDLIVTGDNHKPFTETWEGRLLVNPGSMTRQRASETHRPRVYLWYAEENRVETVYLPIEQGVITREHIEHTEERNARIDAFVSRLDGDWEAALSFEDNMEQFFKTNSVRDTVKDIVYKSME